jgi:hypothetical protein
MPDEPSACDACTKQDDEKVPAGDGGSGDAKDAEEYAEMGARGVRGSGVACTADLCTCIQGVTVLVGRARSLC